MSKKRRRRRRSASPAPAPKKASPRATKRIVGAIAALAVAALVVLLLNVLNVPDSSEPGGRWNVVLVSIDTLRADHLSAYGGAVATPHIDRLAEDGVLFERVQSPSPTTLPSHASLFTARTPARHGVRDNVGFYLAPGTSTLASRLLAEGYRTGGFVGAFVLDSRFGIAEGFEHYFDEFDALENDVAGGFVSQRRGDAVVERALDWLDDVREDPAPFFAFVHLYDPHTPYDPPPPFKKGEDPAERYRGEVAYADALVGELLDGLDARELLRSTLVVLTSDHGESLGEHGEQTHGLFVYESTLRVPLVMRFPGAPEGARVQAYARLVDVAPTVLDLLNVAALEDADGASLVPLIEDPEAEADRAHYAETYFPRLHYGWSELRSLRRGPHKVILAPRPELYDLEADPGETENLFHDEPELASRMKRELLEMTASALAPEPETLDAASRARLESLGYVGGGARAAPSPSTSFDELPDPKDRLDVYAVLNDPDLKSVEPADGAAFDEGLAHLERVLAEDETIPRAHVLYGELLLKDGRLREAEKAFARLAELGGSFEAFYGLGMARRRLGELDGAEEAFRRARELEPRNTKSHFQLAEVLAEKGDASAAERWLRQAIELSPDRFLKERLATLLLEDGRVEEARAIFDGILEEDGEDAVALYNLGQTYLVEGDPERALESFRRAAEASPDDADIQHAIGNASIALGETAAALAAFERAIALSSCHAASHANLGTLLAQLGRPKDAVSELEEAVSCDPTYVHAYKNLAAAHLEAGELDAAIDALERGRRVAPEDEELVGHLRELRAYRARSR